MILPRIIQYKIIFEHIKYRKHGYIQMKQAHQSQSKIIIAVKWCRACAETRKVLFTMRSWNLWLLPTTNRCIGWNSKRKTGGICKKHNKVILQHDNARPHRQPKFLVGKSYTTRHIHYTWLHRINICLDPYRALFHENFSVSMRKSQNGWINRLLPRNQISFTMESICCIINGKKLHFAMEI